MAASKAFLDLIQDMLAPLGHISARRMFGGASLYCDGVLFALVDDDILYLKADASTKARYEAEGAGPFTYEGQTGPVQMSYWRAPERLYDDPDEMLSFVRDAVHAAMQAKSAQNVKMARGAKLPKKMTKSVSVPGKNRASTRQKPAR